jgi:hypothetical protein
MAATVASARAAPSDGPGGTSRFFHVECGVFSPGGSAAWGPQLDDAVVADGYGYSVDGKTWRGAGEADFCWFFNVSGSITVRCPKGVEGTLYLYFLDLGSSSRKQTVTVAGKYTDPLEGFIEPDGRWCQYQLTAADTRQGSVRIELVKTAGANAVISRIDFLPHGVRDSLAPERGPADLTPEGMIRYDWYRQERIRRRKPGCREAVAELLDRGDALVADLAELGANAVAATAAEELVAFRREYGQLAQREEAGRSPGAEWDKLYFDARWVVRRAAFSNPLLDFDELLFVKRITPEIAHQCSHHVGSSQRPGADLCVLSGLGPDGEVRSLLGDQLPPGGIGRPDLSFDARRIVFPYAAPRDEPTAYRSGLPGVVGGACLDYQIHEIGVDGSGLRQLTDGPKENTEPCYLPDGRICFTSSRCDRFVQCGDWAIVFSLHTMNADGSDVRSITEAKEGEWFPSVLDDGRIIYMRWEYVLKPFNTIQYLWTVNPDGTAARLAYGDHFHFSPGPLSFIEARQIPGTSKVVATGAAHHNCGVGPICIVDLARNRGDAEGLARVTPEVGYPETAEMAGTVSRAGWYDSPYPLSEKHFLVSYSFEPHHNSAAGYGIYLIDVHGNKELIYRDPQRSCYSPIPLRPRKRPPVLAPMVAPVVNQTEQEPAESATVLMLDVYQGLDGVEPGTIKYLRVLETLPKAVHSVPQRLDLGIGSGWDPRAILGTVPVERDGSVRFRVPAGKTIFFEVLDENYMDVRRMRSFTNFRPGEEVTCVGCHESYGTAPPNRTVAALAAAPREITPPPWGAGPMDFAAVVQPVLDRRCTHCHDGTEGEAKSFDLTANNLIEPAGADDHYPPAASDPYRVTASFANLLPSVSFTKLTGYEGGNLPLGPYQVGSHRSRLVKLLDAGHYDVKLSPDQRRAIVAWIDCNAPFLGGWEDYVTGTQSQTNLGALP